MTDNIEMGEVVAGAPTAPTPVHLRPATSGRGPVQAMQALPNGPANPPTPELELRFVKAGKEGSGIQHIPTFEENEPTPSIVANIKNVVKTSNLDVAAHWLLGQKVALYAGHVTLQSNADLEAQRALVFIEPEGRNFLPHATYAYHHPDKCLRDEVLVSDLKPYCRVHDGALGPKPAVIQDWKVDKMLVGCQAFVASAASIGAGGLAGALRHDAGFGVAVAGGSCALLAFVAFVMAKLAK